MQVITFLINDVCYAIDIMSVKEISEESNVLNLDNMPESISGLIDLRGVLIPLVDPYTRFYIQDRREDEETILFLVVMVEDTYLALQIDNVLKVVEIDAKEILNSPKRLDQIDNDYIVGIVKGEKKEFISILDIKAIFNTEELKLFSAINRDRALANTPVEQQQSPQG